MDPAIVPAHLINANPRRPLRPTSRSCCTRPNEPSSPPLGESTVGVAGRWVEPDDIQRGRWISGYRYQPGTDQIVNAHRSGSGGRAASPGSAAARRFGVNQLPTAFHRPVVDQHGELGDALAQRGERRIMSGEEARNGTGLVRVVVPGRVWLSALSGRSHEPIRSPTLQAAAMTLATTAQVRGSGVAGGVRAARCFPASLSALTRRG